jgi:hypothetical protein
MRKRIKKLKKVFLPKWTAWFVLLIILPILVVLQYEAYYGSEPYPLMGAVSGFMLVLVIIVTFLLSYGQIPYLLIEG